MLQRYLLLWLTLLSIVALAWPRLLEPLGVAETPFDPFTTTAEYGVLKLLIVTAMFAVGSLLPRDEFRELRRRWPTVLGGTAIQFTAMPLLACTAAHLMNLGQYETVGLIMVGCVPGAMASNVLTLAAKGHVSYSVSLTTSATLLSPLVVPLTLKLTLGEHIPIDPAAQFVQLLTLVVGPVLAGHILCRYSSTFRTWMQAAGPILANGAILWIVVTVVGLNRERLGETTLQLLGALLAVNLLGYAAGFYGGRLMGLPAGMRRALTLEVGMQNAGLGTVLVLGMFQEHPEAAIPTAAYTFGCMLTGTVLAQIWSRHPAADESREPATR